MSESAAQLQRLSEERAGSIRASRTVSEVAQTSGKLRRISSYPAAGTWSDQARLRWWLRTGAVSQRY